MIKNYLKMAVRVLKKNKGFTLINILGLAMGLATCMLIVFYVNDELGYDQFNLKADRIFRVDDEIKFGGNENTYAVSPAPLADALKRDYPEVEDVVRFRMNGNFQIKKGNQNLHENHVVYADGSLFNVFTLPLIEGDAKTALVQPHTAAITETIAKKYFNTPYATGKTLIINDTALYKVSAVLKDMPQQSHIRFDIFLSMASLPESRNNAWLSNNFNTYVLVKNNANPQDIEKGLPKMLEKYVGPEMQRMIHQNYSDFERSGNYFKMKLMPLKKIHLYSNAVAELGANGNIQYVYIFTAIAIFILLIACVNFMNLSTARSSNRALEVGVRKVLGSDRKQLIFQFLAESFLITTVAAVIAVIATWLLLPSFNSLADKQFSFTATSLLWIVPSLLITVVITSLIAGWYPAFFLSAFQPVKVLKGNIASGFRNGWLRSSLVVFQFAISVFLIVGTLVIYKQLDYIRNKNLGYDRAQVLTVWNVDVLGNHAKTFKQEVKQLPGVVDATLSEYFPTGGSRNSNGVFQSPTLDQKTAIQSQTWYVDEDYINTLGIKMKTGRQFLASMPTDSSAVIINETAAKLLGQRDPINKPLYFLVDVKTSKTKKCNIIGVVKDFNFNSLRENITPVMLLLQEDRGALNVRIKSANFHSVLAQIQDKWKSLSPNQEFSSSFMDKDFERTYRADQRRGTIFIVFTSLAIIIACLGLFGLATYAAEQRTKEIGIRKVLGAGVSSIVTMLSVQFLKLVLVALVIALPFAWLMMKKWLQDFAYQVPFDWWIPVAASLLAIAIAILTVSSQAIRAAVMNPVKSLRSE